MRAIGEARIGTVTGWGAFVQGGRSLEPMAKTAAIGFGVMCAVPPASSYSPGAAGYATIFVLLAVGGLWISEKGSPNTCRIGWIECLALGLGMWLVLTLAWGDGAIMPAAMAVVLAVMAAAVPWLLLRSSSSDPTHVFGYACAAGTVGSVFAALPMTWLLHPYPLVLRPGLPIGGASNNAVGFILLLSGALLMAKVDRSARLVWLALGLTDVLLVVQSMSRAGWLLTTAFVVIMVGRRLRARWVTAAIAALGALVVAVLQYGLRGGGVFTDSTRVGASATALVEWGRTPLTMIVGRGPGSVWPWMEEEVAWRSHELPSTYLRDVVGGQVLYHAHSTLLALLVEHGIIGLVIFVVLLWNLCRCAVVIVRCRNSLDILAIGFLLSVPAMFVELYLLRSFPSAVLWWTAAWYLSRAMPADQKAVGP